MVNELLFKTIFETKDSKGGGGLPTGGIGNTINNIGSGISKVGNNIASGFSKLIGIGSAILAGVSIISVLIDVFRPVVNILTSIFKLFGELLRPIVNTMILIIRPFIELFRPILQVFTTMMSPFMDLIKTMSVYSGTLAKQAVLTEREADQTTDENLKKFLIDEATQLREGMFAVSGLMVSTVVAPIKEMIKDSLGGDFAERALNTIYSLPKLLGLKAESYTEQSEKSAIGVPGLFTGEESFMLSAFNRMHESMNDINNAADESSTSLGKILNDQLKDSQDKFDALKIEYGDYTTAIETDTKSMLTANLDVTKNTNASLITSVDNTYGMDKADSIPQIINNGLLNTLVFVKKWKNEMENVFRSSSQSYSRDYNVSKVFVSGKVPRSNNISTPDNSSEPWFKAYTQNWKTENIWQM